MANRVSGPGIEGQDERAPDNGRQSRQWQNETSYASQLEELRLLYETSHRISTAVDIDEVIQAYLEQVGASGRYVCSVALYERDANGRRKTIVVRGRWTPETGITQGGESHPYTPDSLDALLDTGQTVTISDVSMDLHVPPGLRAIQLAAGRPALAMVPLMVRGIRIGLVLMSCASAHEWQRTELQPYQATAAQLATAIDCRQQIQRLHERSRQVALLEERQRLARELHDSVTQILFTITLIAQSIAPAWQRDPTEGEQRVDRLLELSQAAQREMRRLLAELRPSGEALKDESSIATVAGRLRQDGLAVLLRQHLAHIPRDGWRVFIQTSGYSSQSPELEQTLFLVAKEAIHNAVKHADARSLRIRLQVRDGVVELRVKDNGVGFVPGRLDCRAPGDHLGLITMRERIAAAGGEMHIVSAPGRGTTIEACLPIA